MELKTSPMAWVIFMVSEAPNHTLFAGDNHVWRENCQIHFHVCS
jgi:hypothetical protein